MIKRDKNIFIVTIFAIILVIAWTLSTYLSSKKESAESAKEAIVTDAEENIDEPTEDMPKNEIPFITATELYKKIFIDTDILIVDVRDVAKFRKGHIENSKHISEFDATTAPRTIVFITDSGNENSIISYHTRLKDSSDVFNLKAGFNSWINSNYNVISQEIEKNFVNISKVKFLEPRELDEIIKTTDDVIVVDARRQGNHDKERIPKSINIPFEELEFRHNELSSTQEIFVYGFDEEASFEASVLLYDLGHMNVNPVAGGFSAWKEYGYPIEI